MIRVSVGGAAIDVAAEYAAHDSGGHGASASFVGRVRGAGGLAELFLEHHPLLTERGLVALAEEAAARWNLAALTLIHRVGAMAPRSEEHTSELQSLMRISYAVFCLNKKKQRRLIKETARIHHPSDAIRRS